MPDRIIRESICTSDTLNLLSDFEERFWHRLIVNCDDFGRFYANPAILRGKLFPLSDGKTKKDMTDALNKLASVGLVELYTVDGKPFLHVVTWSKYQRTRAKVSKFPAPEDGIMNCQNQEVQSNCSHVKSHDGTCCQMSSNVPVFECEMRNAYSKCEGVSDARARDPAVAAVQADYLNRINPSASPNSLDELAGFVEAMGPDVCKRAFDIALDCKKATWPYIRAILQDKQKNGVRCLADWDALDSKQRSVKGSGDASGVGWMKKYIQTREKDAWDYVGGSGEATKGDGKM